MIRQSGIRQRVLIFSAVFFVIVIAGGFCAFFFSMRQIVRESGAQELSRLVENKTFQLEGSVTQKISLALAMANSPTIKRHLANPEDEANEVLAAQELAGYRSLFKGDSIFWINDVEKVLVVDGAPAYTVDPAAPNQEWYNQTMYQTESYIFTIGTQKGDDGVEYMNLWLDVPVFDERHKPIGVVGAAIVLNNFISDLYRSSGQSSSEIPDFYLFNQQAEVTGARDAKVVSGKKKITEIFADGEAILKLTAEARDKGLVTINRDSIQYVVGYIAMLDWYITAALPITPAMYVGHTITGVFVAMILVIMAIFIIFNGFLFNILKPLHVTMTILSEIAAKWDLTKRFSAKSSDEFGNMAQVLNQTFGKIQELIGIIKHQTGSLSSTGALLSTNMTETATTTTEITANIQSLKEQITSQAAEVTETGSAMERTIGRINTLNEHIAAQSQSVSQSTAAIEQMMANIHSVVETLVKNSQNTSSLTESSEAGKGDLQKVSDGFAEITRQSEGLLEINGVMENIASQTNLLSMNAAIEAAHAGEAGKGFAVVAGEIRKLAESSSAQSKTTADMLKKIKASIDSLTQSTLKVLNTFEIIDTGVKTVSDQEQSILLAMKEQEAGSQEILTAIGALNNITGLVKKQSIDMASESEKVMQRSQHLEQLTNAITQGMERISVGANQVNVSVTQVDAVSNENKQSIDTLMLEVDKFKID